MEHALNGKGPMKIDKTRRRSKKAPASAASTDLSVVEPRDPVEIAQAVLSACNRKRKAAADGNKALVTDDDLYKMARFTDKFKLKSYERFLHYVPRLVNIVTVCAPLIAEACVFSTVFSVVLTLCHPACAACRSHTRSRERGLPAARPPPDRSPLPQLLLRTQEVQRGAAGLLRAAVPRTYFSYRQTGWNRYAFLTHHTAHLTKLRDCVFVRTGTSGPVAARLALLRAQRQLYQDAGVHVHVRNFAVRANIECQFLVYGMDT